MFIVKFVSEKSNDEFLALPTKLRAKMAQMILLLEKVWQTWRTAYQKIAK